jgi:hypothetical protein
MNALVRQNRKFIQVDCGETRKTYNFGKQSHNLKKHFQSSWTKDTIDGGIDKGVFAASKK